MQERGKEASGCRKARKMGEERKTQNRKRMSPRNGLCAHSCLAIPTTALASCVQFPRMVLDPPVAFEEHDDAKGAVLGELLARPLHFCHPFFCRKRALKGLLLLLLFLV